MGDGSHHRPVWTPATIEVVELDGGAWGSATPLVVERELAVAAMALRLWRHGSGVSRRVRRRVRALSWPAIPGRSSVRRVVRRPVTDLVPAVDRLDQRLLGATYDVRLVQRRPPLGRGEVAAMQAEMRLPRCSGHMRVRIALRPWSRRGAEVAVELCHSWRLRYPRRWFEAAHELVDDLLVALVSPVDLAEAG